MEWILIADLNRLGRVSSFIWPHLHLVCACVCLCVYVHMQAWGRARVCNNYNFTLFRHLEKRAKQSTVISVCDLVHSKHNCANVFSVSVCVCAHMLVSMCVQLLIPLSVCMCVYVRERGRETVCICSRILTLQKWHVFSIYPILSPHIRCLQKTEH